MNRRVLTGVCTCYSVPVLNLMAQLLNHNKAVSPLSKKTNKKKKRKRKNWAVNVKKAQCVRLLLLPSLRCHTVHRRQTTNDREKQSSASSMGVPGVVLRPSAARSPGEPSHQPLCLLLNSVNLALSFITEPSKSYNSILLNKHIDFCQQLSKTERIMGI